MKFKLLAFVNGFIALIWLASALLWAFGPAQNYGIAMLNGMIFIVYTALSFFCTYAHFATKE